ncbi:MAG: hypothetical protein EXR57_03980 [Dehalococcoidia bacterium]|nr:hypothetical protein [Dehalococcoidia bacterium]MSQ34962.1 hypothetical protein [Dehalococcoidia bacterium]
MNHHSVYVIELDPAASPVSGKARRRPPCVYVGLTGLTVEQRFKNHKRGHKASRIVFLHGKRITHELFDASTPLGYGQALEEEQRLAASLRRRGFIVFGGH